MLDNHINSILSFSLIPDSTFLHRHLRSHFQLYHECNKVTNAQMHNLSNQVVALTFIQYFKLSLLLHFSYYQGNFCFSLTLLLCMLRITPLYIYRTIIFQQKGTIWMRFSTLGPIGNAARRILSQVFASSLSSSRTQAGLDGAAATMGDFVGVQLEV